MHLRCMTLITQIVLCAVQKVNEKKENKMRKMYSAQICQKIRKSNSKEKIKMGILVDSPKKNEYNVKQFEQDEV